MSEKTTYSVRITKPRFSYYSYNVEANNENEAIEIVNNLIKERKLDDNQLIFEQQEDDYGFNDNPEAFEVVDAMEMDTDINEPYKFG